MKLFAFSFQITNLSGSIFQYLFISEYYTWDAFSVYANFSKKLAFLFLLPDMDTLMIHVTKWMDDHANIKRWGFLYKTFTTVSFSFNSDLVQLHAIQSIILKIHQRHIYGPSKHMRIILQKFPS